MIGGTLSIYLDDIDFKVKSEVLCQELHFVILAQIRELLKLHWTYLRPVIWCASSQNLLNLFPEKHKNQIAADHFAPKARSNETFAFACPLFLNKGRAVGGQRGWFDGYATDNLISFSEAIKSAYSDSLPETSIVHQIRNSLKYVILGESTGVGKHFVKNAPNVFKENQRINFTVIEKIWREKYSYTLKN